MLQHRDFEACAWIGWQLGHNGLRIELTLFDILALSPGPPCMPAFLASWSGCGWGGTVGLFQAATTYQLMSDCHWQAQQLRSKQGTPAQSTPMDFRRHCAIATDLHPSAPACIIEAVHQLILEHHASLDAPAPQVGPVTCHMLGAIGGLLWDVRGWVLQRLCEAWGHVVAWDWAVLQGQDPPSQLSELLKGPECEVKVIHVPTAPVCHNSAHVKSR